MAVKKTLEEKFWDRIRRTDGCWIWTGARNDFGYGHFKLADRKTINAHRWMYMKATGKKITRKTLIRHTCGVPYCVRPEHLKAVND